MARQSSFQAFRQKFLDKEERLVTDCEKIGRIDSRILDSKSRITNLEAELQKLEKSATGSIDAQLKLLQKQLHDLKSTNQVSASQFTDASNIARSLESRLQLADQDTALAKNEYRRELWAFFEEEDHLLDSIREELGQYRAELAALDDEPTISGAEGFENVEEYEEEEEEEPEVQLVGDPKELKTLQDALRKLREENNRLEANHPYLVEHLQDREKENKEAETIIRELEAAAVKRVAALRAARGEPPLANIATKDVASQFDLDRCIEHLGLALTPVGADALLRTLKGLWDNADPEGLGSADRSRWLSAFRVVPAPPPKTAQDIVSRIDVLKTELEKQPQITFWDFARLVIQQEGSRNIKLLPIAQSFSAYRPQRGSEWAYPVGFYPVKDPFSRENTPRDVTKSNPALRHHTPHIPHPYPGQDEDEDGQYYEGDEGDFGEGDEADFLNYGDEGDWHEDDPDMEPEPEETAAGRRRGREMDSEPVKPFSKPAAAPAVPATPPGRVFVTVRRKDRQQNAPAGGDAAPVKPNTTPAPSVKAGPPTTESPSTAGPDFSVLGQAAPFTDFSAFGVMPVPEPTKVTTGNAVGAASGNKASSKEESQKAENNVPTKNEGSKKVEKVDTYKPSEPKAADKPSEPKAADKPLEPKAAGKPLEPKAADKPSEPKAADKPSEPKADKPSETKGVKSFAAAVSKNLPAPTSANASMKDVATAKPSSKAIVEVKDETDEDQEDEQDDNYDPDQDYYDEQDQEYYEGDEADEGEFEDEEDQPIVQVKSAPAKGGNKEVHQHAAQQGNKPTETNKQGEKATEGNKGNKTEGLKQGNKAEGLKQGDKANDSNKQGNKANDSTKQGNKANDNKQENKASDNKQENKASDSNKQKNNASDSNKQENKASDSNKQENKARDSNKQENKANDNNKQGNNANQGVKQENKTSEDKKQGDKATEAKDQGKSQTGKDQESKDQPKDKQTSNKGNNQENKQTSNQGGKNKGNGAKNDQTPTKETENKNSKDGKGNDQTPTKGGNQSGGNSPQKGQNSGGKKNKNKGR